jgi:threonine aldolase
MGNIVSQLAHLGRGQELIAPSGSHILNHEAGGHAVIVGASARTVAERPDGTMDLDEVAAAFRDPTDPHNPITGMVELENTHADSMAQPISPEYSAALAAVAHERGVPLHVDGARFWNAAVALGVTGRDLAAAADSVTFCLSKGLACPVGSVVVGSEAFIERARRGRKLLGGGMRQAGVLAAAGLIALRDGSAGMIERLAEDHANARRLAEGLAELPGILSPGGIAQPEEGPLDPGRVRTDFVLFRVRGDRSTFLEALAARGVLMIDYSKNGQIRAVTHYGVSQADIDRTISAVRDTLAETAARAPSSGETKAQVRSEPVPAA